MDNYNFNNINNNNGYPPNTPQQRPTATRDNLGMFSLILGVAGCFTSMVYYIGIVCAVSAIVLAILSRSRAGRFEGKAVIGLCLGVSGIVLSLMFFTVILTMLQNPDLMNNLQTYMNSLQ